MRLRHFPVRFSLISITSRVTTNFTVNTPQFLITFIAESVSKSVRLFTNIFEELVDFSELILKDINYKDQIARYFHKTFNKPIKYKEIEVSDDPNEKIYTAALDVDENILTVGKGNTKKRAEQQAAKNRTDSL